MTHEGHVSFFNTAVLEIGETAFLPLEHRKSIFNTCLTLSPGESATYQIAPNKGVEVLGVEVDPRYGKVAIVKEVAAYTSSP